MGSQGAGAHTMTPWGGGLWGWGLDASLGTEPWRGGSPGLAGTGAALGTLSMQSIDLSHCSG